MLVSRNQRLELIVTRDPAYRHMVPALLGRTVQIEVNHWLQVQARTALPVAFPALTDVFNNIDRHKQWEPSFPGQYLNVPRPAASPVSLIPTGSSAGSTANTTAASTLTTNSDSIGILSPPTTSSPASSNTQSSRVVRHVGYNDAVFGRFKALGHKAQAVNAYVRKHRIAYPTTAAGNNMCMSFHVLGICNDACHQAADHIVHTLAEDDTLRAWCDKNFKIE